MQRPCALVMMGALTVNAHTKLSESKACLIVRMVRSLFVEWARLKVRMSEYCLPQLSMH